MAKKNATAKVEAATQDVAPEVVLQVEAPAEAPATQAKRVRGYAQAAIDKADIDRLNLFKSHIKDTIGINVSNQRIIQAALDMFAENVEQFLKELTEEAHNKKRQKDLAAYQELKAKLEAEGLLEGSTEKGIV